MKLGGRGESDSLACARKQILDGQGWNNKAWRTTILEMRRENPEVMEPVVCNINLNAVYQKQAAFIW